MKQRKQKGPGFLGLLVVLAALVTLTACGPKTAAAEKQCEKGQEYLAEQNYVKAVEAFTGAIEKDPENISARMGRGNAYFAMAEYEKALEDYRTVSAKTESMSYTRALSYICRAESYEKMNQFDRAIAEYRVAKALLKASDAGKVEGVSEAEVNVRLVQVLYAQTALYEKIKSYDKALENYAELVDMGEEEAERRQSELLAQRAAKKDPDGEQPAKSGATGETGTPPAPERRADASHTE